MSDFMAMCNLVINIKVKPFAAYVMLPFVLLRVNVPTWLFKRLITCEVEAVRK